MKVEVLRGTVGRVFFVNPESPAMAGVLDLDDGRTIRFKGKTAASVGDILEITGQWVNDPKFGRQFSAESGTVQMDESPEALVKLLSTGKQFKGLGPARARKVVDAAMAVRSAGEDASDVLIRAPQAIAQAAGVPLDVIENAAAAWSSKKTYFDALAHLGEQGWSSAQAMQIVDKFGENAPTLVAGNPYMLIGKLPRFAFRTVDAVARNMGIGSTDPHRLSCGIAFCLDRIANEGSTWTSKESLVLAALEELQPDTLDGEMKVSNSVEEMISAGLVLSCTLNDGRELLADAKLAAKELGVFRRLLDGLQSSVPDMPSSALNLPVVSTLNDGQRHALMGVFENIFSIVCGGAGVGKTYLMDAICDVASEAGMRIVLCAPTGRAARKLEHSTRREAKTIHRTLEAFHEDGKFHFRRNSHDPLDADIVILDEFSMVDVRLMHSLLEAISPGAKLVMVGDHNQIPSVGPGAILRDILDGRNRYPRSVHVLTEIVRQAGVLARNTTAVLHGVVSPSPEPSWEVLKIDKANEGGVAGVVSWCVEQMLTSPDPIQPFGRHLDRAWDIQVLSPMRKGPGGTFALNAELQRLYQRLLGNEAPESTPEGKPPKPMIGDRIIWTKNDYELDLLNGTQAIVMGLPKGGAMEIYTEEGREVTVPTSKRLNVEVAYAMTIHKSQGSEWPAVILVGSSSHWHMHDRNLFYTGASRASEALKIVGDSAGIRHFAKETRSARRQTFGALVISGDMPAGSTTTGGGPLDSSGTSRSL